MSIEKKSDKSYVGIKSNEMKVLFRISSD